MGHLESIGESSQLLHSDCSVTHSDAFGRFSGFVLVSLSRLDAVNVSVLSPVCASSMFLTDFSPP